MTADVDASIHQFLEILGTSPLAPQKQALQDALAQHYFQKKHGRKDEWDQAFEALPATQPATVRLDTDYVTIGSSADLKESGNLQAQLQVFKPWRKGPWRIFGTEIDTEWRSDWKWNRIRPHLSPLQDRSVLDIGCGNGYHLFRMLGEGASLAVGIDPTRLFLYQFAIARRYLPHTAAYLLPLRSEHLPAFGTFDTVFSLGVLYHRRSPVDHLTELLSFLSPGGELVLETLVVPGDKHTILVPTDRYAMMANVWFLPSTGALETLVARAGFRNVRTVDVNLTTTEEQRATDWMTFNSLPDFLDPEDSSLTAEGYPAPRRAIVMANRP
ncbi:MAG: tRNA 5-methoxyuridine(34)/uridine 5-oxyacetic acid(34) synthase CmoB [Pseudomonadales bacterium]|nr:tRNA 5-methoxyuridine(34)/uridine 5-oxyacetic acid(34) synthase CmoB [Pseudomonadales bacterium]